MPPLTKTCPKTVQSDKGGSLCVKDVFAKKFFGAGRDSAGGALVRNRLQAALPRLQQQLKQAREWEYTEQWREDYAAVKARRDELVPELRERNPQLVDEIVGLMTRMAETDR